MAPRRESGVPSARTVLEVADGLRWTDPGLGASLAEHALRLAGDDAAIRTAAERSVIRSLAEVDRFDEVVSRATPLVDDAQIRGDREDLAGLLAELAGAAIGLGDVAVAGRLVQLVRPGGDLAARTVTLAGLVRAQVAAATGDVAGADRAAEEAGATLLRTPEPEAGLMRRDLARATAAARRRGGQSGAALPIVAGALSEDPGSDADGGRRALLAAADEVDLLLDLDRRGEALERAAAVLPDGPSGPVAVCATARVRLALAERVHVVAGAHALAHSLAHSAATELEAAGHDAAAARAWEVVATVAERAGELGTALTAVRHGHELDSRARDRRDPALRVLTMIAAAAPDLHLTADDPAPTAVPEPVAVPGSTALSEVESLLADARSSVAGGVNGTESLPRRRSHRREVDADDRPASEPVPEALARVLGAAGLTTGPAEDATTSPPSDGSTIDETWGGTYGRQNGRRPSSLESEMPSSGAPTSPGSGRRSRHSAEYLDDLSAQPLATAEPEASRPTFDAFSTAPGRQAESGASGTGVGGDGAGSAGGSSDGPEDPGAPSSELPDEARNGHTPESATQDRFLPVDPEPSRDHSEPLAIPSLAGDWGPLGESDADVDIDPADPLGTASSWGAGAAAVRPVANRGPDESAAPGRADGDRATEPPPGEDVGTPGPTRQETEPRAEGGSADQQGHETDGRPETPPGRDSQPRVVPPGFDLEDLDDELPLTLAGLLAEYHLPDVPAPPYRNGTPRSDVAVPSARRHLSGSMPVPAADPRFAARPAEGPDRTRPGATDGATQGPPRKAENGARLADLLAEAMDAFRHTGPGAAPAGRATELPADRGSARGVPDLR